MRRYAWQSVEPPQGLAFQPEFLSPAEERALLGEIEALAFEGIRMHGVVAKRTARHFGFDYDYDARQPLEDAEPFPAWLVPLRDRCAALAGVARDELVEALVQRYPEGAQIGWHRDAPMFGVVVGVSLLGGCRLRMRRGAADEREVYEVALPPCSAYVFAGEARTKWQHHVPPTKELRYSVTFRTVRGRS